MPGSTRRRGGVKVLGGQWKENNHLRKIISSAGWVKIVLEIYATTHTTFYYYAQGTDSLERGMHV